MSMGIVPLRARCGCVRGGADFTEGIMRFARGRYKEVNGTRAATADRRRWSRWLVPTRLGLGAWSNTFSRSLLFENDETNCPYCGKSFRTNLEKRTPDR